MTDFHFGMHTGINSCMLAQVLDPERETGLIRARDELNASKGDPILRIHQNTTRWNEFHILVIRADEVK